MRAMRMVPTDMKLAGLFFRRRMNIYVVHLPSDENYILYDGMFFHSFPIAYFFVVNYATLYASCA